MIALTDNALDAVRRVLQGADLRDAGLRITVEGGGCAGYSYRLELDDRPGGDDAIVDVRGVRVIVDSSSWPLLDGAEVDFIDGASGAGFVFNNPNAKCGGCGKSSC